MQKGSRADRGTTGHVGKVAGGKLLAQECEVRGVLRCAVVDLDKAVTLNLELSDRRRQKCQLT